MGFWQLDVEQLERPAVLWGQDVQSAGQLSYRQLREQIADFVELLGQHGEKQLGMILCQNKPQAIVAYLAALNAHHAVILLNNQTDPDLLQAIVAQYHPDWIYAPESAGLSDGEVIMQQNAWHLLRYPQRKFSIHSDLAILLSTSGTTGSPKMVKLSYQNIHSNACAIAEYLNIRGNDRSITTLPFNYSFGMSILNSYFQVGAALVLTEASLMNSEFWQTLSYHKVTSFSGVPYSYQMLHRLNPRKMDLSTLRTMTQAGGRLSVKLIEYFREFAEAKGILFYVMYGQTEAAPRISYVPPEKLATKAGSIGIAIPRGELAIAENGELLYRGDNVMMGYALNRSELSVGDEMQGVLNTGDIASVDEDGYFYIHGRLKRFIKMYGNRISLDDIEKHLEEQLMCVTMVAGGDDRLKVYVSGDVGLDAVSALLQKTYHLHPTSFVLRHITAIPVTSSGKKDYAQLG